MTVTANPCRPPEICRKCKEEITEEDLILRDELEGSTELRGGMHQVEVVEGYQCPHCGYIERIS